MRTGTLAFIWFFSLAVVSACTGSDEQSCQTVLDCPPGSYCGPDKICRTDCALDFECSEGQICNEYGKCVPPENADAGAQTDAAADSDTDSDSDTDTDVDTDVDTDADSDPGIGNLKWAISAGGAEEDLGLSITALPGEAMAVTGWIRDTVTFGAGENGETTLESAGENDIFIARYNLDGSLDWVVRGGGTYDDRAHGIASLPDGSIVIAGAFQDTAVLKGTGDDEIEITSTGSHDIFVAKYDSNGNIEWAESAGSNIFDYAARVAVISDGSCIVVGGFNSSATFGKNGSNEVTLESEGLYDAFIAKYDPDGRLEWARGAGGSAMDQANRVAVFSDGSSVVSGQFTDTAVFGKGEPAGTNLEASGAHDIFLARYSKNGSLVWVQQAGGKDNDEGAGIAALSDGSVLLTGYFEDTATFGRVREDSAELTAQDDSEVFIAKFDDNGKVEWTAQTRSSGSALGSGLKALSSGYFYITGYFSDTAVFGSGEDNETALDSRGSADVFLALYDGNGMLKKVINAGGTGEDFGSEIDILSGGDIVMSGAFESTAVFDRDQSTEKSLESEGDKDIFVARYSD